MFSQRRERALQALGADAVAVLPATPVHVRNGDVEHDYRPHSDLYWLTGFTEPEAVLVLRPGHPEHPVVMFVRARDPEREIWDGPRAGTEGAVTDHGASVAFPMTELDTRLPELLVGRDRLFYALGDDRVFDDRVIRALGTARTRCRKTGRWPTQVIEPSVVLHELRLRKSPDEIERMRMAAEITRKGFDRAFDVALPGRFEHEVEGALRGAFRAEGSERPAYAPIVGSGPNACVLHYQANNRRMEPGDLVLIDAGAEYGCYACDVTRTFPVGGTFSLAQREVYELVLAAQTAAIGAVKPGVPFTDIHDAAVRVVTDGLVRLGWLTGETDALIKDNAHRAFFMHGSSHWLGMDVHDVGRYHDGEKARTLEPGMVLTVEPGIYVGPTDERVPEAYRGIGVRIEDDVLVTAEGARVLTESIPRSVAALEARLAARGSGVGGETARTAGAMVPA